MVIRKNFDYEDIQKQVFDFLVKLGIQPHDESDVKLDGELHRYRVHDDKPGQKSGAICIHTDGWPAGFAMDWRKGIKENWKYDISALNISDEQRNYYNSEEYKKKCEDEHRKQEDLRKRKHMEASERARRLWENLTEAPHDHPYLLRKNLIWLDKNSLRYNPNTRCLAVPLRRIDTFLMSIQWIPEAENEHKLFFKDAEISEAFFSLGLDELIFNPKEIILLGEGFATMVKVFELTGKPCVAAMSCYRLEEIAKILRKTYPEASIIITADNDHETERKTGINPGILYANNIFKSKVNDKLIVDNVSFPLFASEEHGSDWDDFAILHGNDYTANLLNQDISDVSVPSDIRSMLQQEKIQFINAQSLRVKVFEPIKWVVPGLIPPGLSILGGGPKIGKSFFALQTALAISIGGYALGKIPVVQGDVLYLALEDNERRLQERIDYSNAINEGDDISRLTLAYTVPRQHDGGLRFIEWWIQQQTEPRLVIIDTFQKFRKQSSGKINVYAEDYDVLSEIKRLADKYALAIFLLHHLKKLSLKQELSDDWIYSFSGSAGISGSADALFVLKRDRNSKNGYLYRTGRDVEEKVFKLTLDGFGWTLDGEAEEFMLPEWKKRIIDFLKSGGNVTPMDLAQSLDISANTAKQQLSRLAKEGLLLKSGYGRYSLK